MYIAKGGVLLGVKGLSHTQAVQKRAVEGAIEGAVKAAAKRPQRAVYKYSICKLIEYNTCTCPRRQISS